MSTLAVALIVYLITIISSVDGFLMFLMFVGGFSTFLAFAVTVSMYSENSTHTTEEEEFNKEMAPVRTWRRWSVAIFILGSTSIFIPDEEQAITIAAVAIGYEGVTTIVENERVQEIGGKTFDLLEDWLDSKIEELHNGDSQTQSQTEGETNGNS